jgi:hypothetical protein
VNPLRVVTNHFVKLARVVTKHFVKPVRIVTKQFLCRSSMTLLGFGLVVSGIDSLFLYIAASREGVLHIDKGVGLLNNLGLISTVAGNAISLYAVRKYYDHVCAIRVSEAVVDIKPIKPALVRFTAMIRGHKRFLSILIILVVVGAALWTSNVMSHVLYDPQVRWGHKVFDSRDHPLSFIASRFHNLYTWLVILPFVVHVMIVTTFHLRRMITLAYEKKALKYDLLNPDERGGFRFVDNALTAFNLVVALIYVQITLHILTFEKINPDHAIGYGLLTVALIGINWFFFDIYEKIKTLRFESLNELKDRIFDDKLNFDVLKYCMEQKSSLFPFETIAIKAVGIIIPPLAKLLF